MQRKLRRNLTIAIAVAAVAVGVIVSVAPRGAHRHSANPTRAARHVPGSQTQLAADYLGLTRSQLRRRLRAGETLSQIARSIPGRSSGGMIDALLAPRVAQLKAEDLSADRERTTLARLRARVLLEVAAAHARRGDIPTAAAKMGLSETTLRQRLQRGATLAQIAESTKTSSVAGLIDALIAARAQRLQVALLAKSITASQEKKASAALRARVTREVNRKLLQSG